MSNVNVKILQVAWHRNGIAGEAFHVVRFQNDEQNMVGIVFKDRGHVAVLDTDLLHDGIIAMGENSWRGDVFEPQLREAVEQYDNRVVA